MENKPSRHTHRPVTLVAQVFSDVFSPLLVPTYAMILSSWATGLYLLPVGTRIWATVAVAVITALLPVLFIGILIRSGRVSDRSISRRNQRGWPFAFIILCYIGAGCYTWQIHAPLWLTAFFGGALGLSIIAMAITLRWKISAHAGALGGLAGYTFWLAVHGLLLRMPLLWTAVTIIVTGAVASSRLILHRHTPGQVFAGAILGFAVMYAVLSLTN